MSTWVRYLEFKCDSCGYSRRAPQPYTSHLYVRQDGSTLTMFHIVAWCHSCKDFMQVENLQRDYFNRRITTLQVAINISRSNPYPKVEDAAKLWGVSGLQLEKAYEWSYEGEKHLLNLISHCQSILELIKDRQSKPACLTCGSNKITFVPDLLNDYLYGYGRDVYSRYANTKIATEILCPQCRGPIHGVCQAALEDRNGSVPSGFLRGCEPGRFDLNGNRLDANGRPLNPTNLNGKKKSKRNSRSRSHLHENPFFLLGATVRDDRKKIVELAEEKSLSHDANQCAAARTALTTPSKRLNAEVAWLPGLSPKQAEKLMAALDSNLDTIRADLSLPSLAEANLLAAAIELLDPEMGADTWCEWIEDLAFAAEEIDPETVMRDIGEDREVGGYPQVLGVDLVEAELESQRKKYAEVIRQALEEFEPTKLVKVITNVVESATNEGTRHAPQLIHDIVERYEIEAMAFLEPEAENINKLADAILEAAPRGEGAVAPLVTKLDKMVRNWDAIAQPIQISALAQGLTHDLSASVAMRIRSLSIELFNEHDMLKTAESISKTLREVFSEVTEVAEKLHEDAKALRNIANERKKSAAQEAEWNKKITFKTEVGLVFKDELKIGPDGAYWKGRGFPLDSISRVRWGAIRKSVNGIPSGTDYTIAFGDNSAQVVVNLTKEAPYSGFLEALWPGVCVRLLFQMVAALKEGKSLTFGEMTIEDEAVTLVKRKLLGSNERIRYGWHDVTVWSANGSFIISANGEKKTNGSASYIETWNTHLLEHLVRGGFKKNVRRLSDYLKDGN